MSRHVTICAVGICLAFLTTPILAGAVAVPLPALQSNFSVAVDSTGDHVVIGMTDLRSGTQRTAFLHSDDGGATFLDGGALPAPSPSLQSFGMPVVTYVSGSTFLYFSSMVAQSPVFRTSIAFHRSTDNGHTWDGPYFVGPTVLANHSAAQPAVDIDPDTGRLAVTWISYPDGGGSRVNATFSDDIGNPQPIWTPAITLASREDALLQGPTPRFAGGGSANFYAVWTGFDTVTANAFIRSTDNGSTFGTPIFTANFGGPRPGLGNDSNLMWPSLAIDHASGDLYLVFASGASETDGGDIRFQKSTDDGLTFSPQVTINSRPAADRSQWFPSITFDASDDHLHVVYYDQGVETTGDFTEITHVFSEDGGSTWSNPRPLTERPFHAGYGNDELGPNLGNFTRSVAQGGELFAAWGGTSPVGFTDGQPADALSVPDAFFRRVIPQAAPSLQLGAWTLSDSGVGPLAVNGSVDPDESIALTIPLENYVTNPLSAATMTTVSGKLATNTPGVTITTATTTYPNIAAGTSAGPIAPVVFTVTPAFVPGTNIELLYTVTTDAGSSTLRLTLATGSPNATTIYSEDFEAVTPPALPAGWTTVHGGGTITVPWTTTAAFRGLTTKSAFHSSVGEDGGVATARHEKLISPVIVIPAAASFVLLELDVEYNTYFPFMAPNETGDGMLLRIHDLTPGATPRTVAVEAFADTFTVDHATLGRSMFYPRRLMNVSVPGYLPDFGAFGADSQGKRHVTLKLTGMAGRSVQLRFEYSQYWGGNCAGPPCGVAVDNISVKSVVAIRPTITTLTLTPNPSPFSQSVTIGASVADALAPAADGQVTFKEGPTVLAGPLALSSGAASFNTSSLAVGSHSITAVYASSSGDYASSGDVKSLTVFLPAPATFSATATSTANVALAWAAVAGADHYRIFRASAGAGYAQLTTSATNAYNDGAVATGTSYAYRVRTVDAALNSSVDSVADLATTMTYTTDAEVATGLPIRAAHLLEARTAVNRVLAAAGQPPATFSDAAPLNQPIRNVHLDELRAALNQARGLLLVQTLSFSNPALAGMPVRAVHLREVLDGTK